MEQILDPKTQLVVALRAATATKCRNCFPKLYSLAPNTGILDSEIRAVVAIAAKSSQRTLPGLDFTARGTGRTEPCPRPRSPGSSTGS